MCQDGYIPCNTSTARVDCIPTAKQCDGYDDCGDNSDEDASVCQNKTSSKLIKKTGMDINRGPGSLWPLNVGPGP